MASPRSGNGQFKHRRANCARRTRQPDARDAARGRGRLMRIALIALAILLALPARAVDKSTEDALNAIDAAAPTTAPAPAAPGAPAGAHYLHLAWLFAPAL